MQNQDLHQKFIYYLESAYPKRKDLVSLLADILKIERESVSRRLNGRVLFTVREMGIIAEKLSISIDHLSNKKLDGAYLHMNMIIPLSKNSFSPLIEVMKLNIEEIKGMCKDSLNIGCIYDSLPVEFFARLKHLCRFMYYKWAYYYVVNIGKSYNEWQIPQEIIECGNELRHYWNEFESVFYILDNSIIWNLMNEVDFFFKMQILSKEDVSLIRADLHVLLDYIEEYTKTQTNNGQSVDIYVSSIHIGMSCSYFLSSKKSFINFSNSFMNCLLCDDSNVFNKVYEWINSMKRLSTLISGSGALERRVFFKKQHKIVDSRLYYE